MTAYMTPAELEPALPADLRHEFTALEPALQAQLLEDASADVDRALGGPRHPATGRAVDLALLLPSQVTAIRRATTEAAAFRLSDPESIRGATEFVPNLTSIAWRGPRPPSPAVVEALAGHSLIRRSGLAEEPLLP